MPAVIELIETGGAGFIEMRREELKSPPKIDPHTGFNRYAIDVADKKVASNLPFNTFLGNGRFISRLLRTPRMEDAELYKAAAPSVFAQPTYPWLTATLLGVIGVIFGLELLYALQPPQGLLGLDTRTLLAFGALNRQLVEYGEWWRLFSYAFLHGNLFHIAFNGVAIYCAGQILENMLGRRWYAAVYIVGAVAGALASILFNSDATVSVGASGAVMALFVMIFMCSRRFPPGPDRAKIQMNAMSVLIPSMLPVMFIGINVDLAAHAGGAIAGLIMGGIIFAFWRKEQPHPPFKVLAGLICAGGAFACFYAFQAVLKGFSAFQAL